MLLRKLMGVSLNQNEKYAVPKLHLHNSADRLNQFVIQNHKIITKEEKEQKRLEDKNKDLLNGLGIKTKVVKVEKEIKLKNHADTQILRTILKMIPIEAIHTKNFSKILHTSKRVTEDGCQFLFELNLIHRSGVNRYRAR